MTAPRRFRTHFPAFAVLVVFAVTSARAHACGCTVPIFTNAIASVIGGCGSMEGNATFVGKVVNIAPVNQHFLARTNHILVIESFTPKYHTGQEVTIEDDGNDCEYVFKDGQTYLIDGNQREGKLYASVCGATQPASSATMEILTLRALAKGDRLPDLSGRVATPLNNAYPPPHDAQPQMGIMVQANPSGGGGPQEVFTDAEGVYTFPTLAPGNYTLTLDLPPHMTTNLKGPAGSITVKVPEVPNRCGNSVNIDVYPTGNIIGQVFGPSGPEFNYYLLAFPSPAEAPFKAGEHYAGMAKATPDGKFEIQGLRDGTYKLLLEFTPPHTHSARDVYYPEAPSLDQAATIEVRDGMSSKPANFTLLPDFANN